MKHIAVYLFCLFICISAKANPFGGTCHIIHTGLSIEFLTRADLISDTIWYSTTMPAYSINYQFNLLNEKNVLHKFSIKAEYFSSDWFKINSVQLDEGELVLTEMALGFEYQVYLPVVSPVSFITGCSLTPKYSYYGQKIAPGKAIEINDIFINVGPLCGFSIHKTDFWEFSTLLGINTGLYVYNTLTFPNLDQEELKYFSLNGVFTNRMDFIFRNFQVGLAYTLRLNIDLSGETFTHAFSLLCGVIF